MMFQKFRNVFFILIFTVITFTGCSADDLSQMPDIVFISYIDHQSIAAPGELYSIEFYDKNGNYYTTDDQYVCYLSYEDMINEYASGKLDDKITFVTSCDVDELFENYQKLCKVSKNKKLEIIYPEVGAAVEEDEISTYGLCYDKNRELQDVYIHEKGEVNGDYETNDERANEIYDWLIGTLQK